MRRRLGKDGLGFGNDGFGDDGASAHWGCELVTRLTQRKRTMGMNFMVAKVAELRIHPEKA
jgi:hypothetical protein